MQLLTEGRSLHIYCILFVWNVDLYLTFSVNFIYPEGKCVLPPGEAHNTQTWTYNLITNGSNNFIIVTHLTFISAYGTDYNSTLPKPRGADSLNTSTLAPERGPQLPLQHANKSEIKKLIFNLNWFPTFKEIWLNLNNLVNWSIKSKRTSCYCISHDRAIKMIFIIN